MMGFLQGEYIEKKVMMTCLQGEYIKKEESAQVFDKFCVCTSMSLYAYLM